MKKFFAIVMILVVVLSMTACSNNETVNSSNKIVYTGEFTITKLEPYHNVPSGWSYLMCAKSEDVGVLLKVLPDVYLQYEIGDTVCGEIKYYNDDYFFKFD